MQKQKIILSLTVIMVLMLQACNLPSSQVDEEPTVDPVLAVGMTLTSLAELTPPTEALPTFTPLPTLTATPEFTTTPNFTPTPTFAYVTLSTATNCRAGASIDFPILDTFDIGLTIEVVGKHPFDNYWYVRSPKNPSLYCWMWGEYATGGNLGNVPVLTPPPSPTPAPKPDFTSSYVDSGGPCPGWWTRINLKNTGPAAFKSISMSITDKNTDKNTSETKSKSMDGFQDVSACALSSVKNRLDPGESTIVVAPSLSADTTGHVVSFSATLCTENGQGGTCISETIEFTP